MRRAPNMSARREVELMEDKYGTETPTPGLLDRLEELKESG